MTQYELSRNWFDWCFENPEKINPNHTAIYFFAIEHCNRLGWKQKFGFPSQMTMEAIGIKKHQTYIKYFRDLVEWGFIILIQESKNQYSANIISLNSATTKNGKALDKANIKHAAKQTESTGQSTWQSNRPISKQITNNQITNKPQTNFERERLIECFVSDKKWIDLIIKNNPHLKDEAAVKKKMVEFCEVLNIANQFPITKKEASNRFAGYIKKVIQQQQQVKTELEIQMSMSKRY